MELTDAMSTGMLTITLRPELIALVTSPADPPSDGTSRASRPASRSVGVLAMLLLWTLPGQMWVVDPNMLLKLLKGVVRSVCKTI